MFKRLIFIVKILLENIFYLNSFYYQRDDSLLVF